MSEFDNKEEKPWTDPHKIQLLLNAKGPMHQAEIARELGMTRQLVSYHVAQGVKYHSLKVSENGLVAAIDYSKYREPVQRAVVKLLHTYDPGGFFNEAEHYISKVAFEIGASPVRIADDYYWVVKKLQSEWQQTGRVA